MYTLRVSAFYRCHCFAVKQFHVGYAQDSRRVPRNAKNAVFDLASPALQSPGIFHDTPVPTSTLTFAAEIAAIRRLYLGCVTSITKA